MTNEQLELLENIRLLLHKVPEFAANITEAMTRGLQESAQIQRERAADMEVVASMAMHNRLFKGSEMFIAQKLRKWEGKCTLKWDDVLERLEK